MPVSRDLNPFEDNMQLEGISRFPFLLWNTGKGNTTTKFKNQDPKYSHIIKKKR